MSASSNSLALKLLEVLGIDTAKVFKGSINFEVNQPVIVKIERYTEPLEIDDLEQLKTEVERFTLSRVVE